MRSQRGETLMIVIAIVLAGFTLIVAPTVLMLDKKYDVAVAEAQRITDEFVAKVRTKGILTQDDLDNYKLELDATGVTWKIDKRIDRVDKNPGKKEGTATSGDGTIYYTIYDTQVEQQLLEGSGTLSLQEKDNFAVTAEATSSPLGRSNAKVTAAGISTTSGN